MNQLITTELSQRQTISPMVYQSLKILQMGCEQLDEYIQDAALENPVLEIDESVRESELQSLEMIKEHLEWVRVNHSQEAPRDNRDDEPQVKEYKAEDCGIDLREHLTAQFDSAITDEEYRLLSCVIDFLDNNGYLTADAREISNFSGFDEELVGYAVSYIQTLDPLGVGARDLTECLLIQLSLLGYCDKNIKRMVDCHLEDIASGYYNKIAKAIGATAEKVRGYCEIIKTLSPKPASCFGCSPALPVLPDLSVSLDNGNLAVTLNERSSSRLYLNSYYLSLFQKDEAGEATAYLADKLSQARWIMDAIESRKKTLEAIAGMVVDYQRAFFLHHDASLRPLTLREVALALKIHESTVSRAISGKYLECRRGMYPLKYFFDSHTKNERDDSQTSRDCVKNRIQKLIAEEDKSAPLSDSRIVELLGLEGITLSRRVIAKYRAEMNIPGTGVRRAGDAERDKATYGTNSPDSTY